MSWAPFLWRYVEEVLIPHRTQPQRTCQRLSPVLGPVTSWELKWNTGHKVFFSLKYRIFKERTFKLHKHFIAFYKPLLSDSRPVVFFAALFGTHHFEPPSSQGSWHTRHQTNQYKHIQTRYSTRISRKHIPAFSGWLLECGVLWYFGVWEGTWEDCVWRKTSIQMCSGHLGPGSETSFWYLCLLEIQNIQCCDAFEHLRSQQLHMSRIPMSINA